MRPFAKASPRKRIAVVSLAVALAVSGIFSVGTAVNYSDLVESRILTEVALDVAITPSYEGANVTSLELEVSLVVHNPGGKPMQLNVVTYQGWIRDVPAEDGLAPERMRDEGQVRLEDGSRMLFYPVFRIIDVQDDIIEAGGTANVTAIQMIFARNEGGMCFSRAMTLVGERPLPSFSDRKRMARIA